VAIDDPLEKIRASVKDEDVDFFGTAFQAGGLLTPFFKIFLVAKSVFDTQSKGNSAYAAIRALCDELERIQSRWPPDFESALETIWFRRAITALIDEARRAANQDHARLLGRVAAHGCFPVGEDANRQEDLASYIHDLARLGTDDIRFLKLLREAYQRVTPGHHDGYVGYYDRYKQKAQDGGFQEDDRIALGTRLGGFGLAYEPPVQLFPGQYFVRPTRRGLYLLSLLDAAELPVAQQS
jgi:hypothetical protein